MGRRRAGGAFIPRRFINRLPTIADRLGHTGDRLRVPEVAGVVAKDREVLSSGGVAALMRAHKGIVGLGQVVVLSEKHGELKCAVGIAPLIGAGVGGCSAGDLTPLLEQRPELDAGLGHAALIRPTVCRLGIGELAASG